MPDLLGGTFADSDSDTPPPSLIGARQALENRHEQERVDLAISQLASRKAMDTRHEAAATPGPELVTQPATSPTSVQGGDGSSTGVADAGTGPGANDDGGGGTAAAAAGDAAAAADAGTGEGF